MGDPRASYRRGFFREAAVRIVTPLADYLENRIGSRLRRAWLRPPGAVAEARLIETCTRCGVCVDACPAEAIFPLESDEGAAAGTPAIDPDAAACVVCDGLKCTTACPSGALLALVEPSDIRMGVAEVYTALCVRGGDGTCTLCVERCPLGESAIVFPDDDPPRVMTPGCVGCGVCQFHCPTEPKAIVVNPA